MRRAQRRNKEISNSGFLGSARCTLVSTSSAWSSWVGMRAYPDAVAGGAQVPRRAGRWAADWQVLADVHLPTQWGASACLGEAPGGGWGRGRRVGGSWAREHHSSVHSGAWPTWNLKCQHHWSAQPHISFPFRSPILRGLSREFLHRLMSHRMHVPHGPQAQKQSPTLQAPLLCALSACKVTWAEADPPRFVASCRTFCPSAPTGNPAANGADTTAMLIARPYYPRRKKKRRCAPMLSLLRQLPTCSLGR